ncbi:MAG: PAS domain S-box protein [Methanomicrobiales archaeon]
MAKIKLLLTEKPAGLTTESISKCLPLNRTSTAKYLNTLLITGQIELQVVGRAKLFKVCNRLPRMQMLSFSSDPVIVVNHERMIREINPQFIETFGTPEQNVVGRKFDTLPSVVDISHILLPGICKANDGQSVSVSHEIKKGNEVLHFRTKYIPIVLDDGMPGAAVVLENITETRQIQKKYDQIVKDTNEHSLRDGGEQKLSRSPRSNGFSGLTPEQMVHELQVHQVELETQAEEIRISKNELEESRDKYLDLCEFAPIGYLTLNDKALVLEVNLTGATLLGVERSRLFNARFRKFIVPEDLDPWDQHFIKVLNHREKQSCTLSILRGDGSTFPVLLEGIRITGKGKENSTVRITICDITDIRNAEETIRQAHDNLEIQVKKRTAELSEVNRNLVAEAAERKKTGMLLQKSEEKYHNLYRNSALGIFHSTFEGRFIDLNPALAEMLGYNSPEEAVTSITSIAGQVYAEPAERDIVTTSTLNAGGILSKENHYRRKDGTLWYGKLHQRIVPEQPDVPAHYEGFVEDVTERRETEKELALTQLRFQNAMDVGNIAWWEMNYQTGNIKFYKKKAEMLGYLPEQFTHYSDFTCLLHPEDYEPTMQAMRDHMTGTKPSYETEYRIKTAAGEYRWFWDIGGISEYDSSGRPFKVMGLVIDISGRKRADEAECRRLVQITEHKRVEEALRLKDFAALSSISAIGVTDLSGNLTYVNPAFLSISGYEDEQDVLGRSIYTFWNAGKELHMIADSLREQGTWSGEITGQKKDGTSQQIQISAHLVRDEAGAPVAMMGSLLDITGIKRAEEELLQANQQISLLTEITRHDILTRVSVISEHLHHARKTVSDPGITALFDTIDANTREIRSQIEFAKVYQTLGSLEPEWLNLDNLISELHVPPHITLQTSIQGIEIFADPLFKLVFFNLVDNSQRHGGDVTKIIISMEHTRLGLIIVCEDNGTGIPNDQKNEIFLRGFKRSTGLGLFLIQEILRITGIKIKETGIEGSGARFEIIVPKGVFRDSKPTPSAKI